MPVIIFNGWKGEGVEESVPVNTALKSFGNVRESRIA